MNKFDVIRNNILPGDILLSRGKLDSTCQTTPTGVRGFWRHAFLYLGNGEVLRHDSQGIYQWSIDSIDKCLSDDLSIGVFRVKKGLLEKEFDSILDSIQKVLNINYNGFYFSFNPEELILIGYKGIGIELCDLPVWKIQPADFDESSITVRIA
jgi:hypothetical protein